MPLVVFQEYMNLFVDPFLGNTFMQRALLAGFLVSISCGVVGTFIVLRGLAFIGDALAHGVLPGIAIAILLGVPGIVGTAISAVVMIGGISLITQKTSLSSDTAIGLLFVSMLALGVVIVSRSSSFSGDLVRILFGEILGINATSVILQAIATVVILVVALVCARPFLLLCFSPEQAQVSGFSSKLYHNIMLAMIALAVIISFQTVGTMLVFGMLLAPAGAAALLAKRIKAMMIYASLIGVVSVYSGLLISYHFNLAAGSSIVLVATLIFFMVLFIKNAQANRIARLERGTHG
ncbi:Manganese transport system membrane protein MntB [bioreactor metagenome]|uniref:Manganese transport system membrane protein MntB n=1 Tax=bioreactor metagenome TaxID=1076179 RepID=A0A644ZA47_9ZZZZ